MWQIGPVLKHCKVPKHYDQDCGSRNWCMIYRSENKSRIFFFSEAAGMQYVLYLCKMILTKSHTGWHTINADHVTSVYFRDWSVNY